MWIVERNAEVVENFGPDDSGDVKQTTWTFAPARLTTVRFVSIASGALFGGPFGATLRSSVAAGCGDFSRPARS